MRLARFAAATTLLFGLVPKPATGWEPVPAAANVRRTQAEIETLIDRLGDDDFFVREKAQSELAALGVAAFDALGEALERRRDVEILERVRYLLREIKIDWVVKGEPDEVERLMQNYEGADDGTRLAVIEQLGAGVDVRVLPALCRIVRFERSPALAKRAAVRIIEQRPAADDDWNLRAETLRRGIGDSPRAPAAWIRAHLVAHDDPAAGAKALGELIEAEMTVFRHTPQRSRADVLIGLWRRQADLLKHLNRRPEAVVAMMNIVALDAGGVEALTEVLRWLVDNQAWAEVDDLAGRFAAKFEADPLLTYELAGARRAQRRTEDETRLVAAALAMNAGDQKTHILTGMELHKRGLIDYSEGEYRHAIGLAPPGQSLTLTAQFMLAESLHDRRRDLEAGKVLEEAADAMDRADRKREDLSEVGRSPATVRARSHYFYALGYAHDGKPDQTKKHLLEGLGEDQYDAEILIALFHVADLEASVRDRVRSLIKDSTQQYREQIKAAPNDDTPYNQLAWLISNTEGDFQEALRASQKSLEIEPGNAGHMDTLARCYFAAGDPENAVKQQRRAIELEPHSQQMRRQLAEFEAARAKPKP